MEREIDLEKVERARWGENPVVSRLIVEKFDENLQIPNLIQRQEENQTWIKLIIIPLTTKFGFPGNEIDSIAFSVGTRRSDEKDILPTDPTLLSVRNALTSEFGLEVVRRLNIFYRTEISEI